MNHLRLLVIALFVMPWPLVAATHDDIVPYVSGNKLFTGGHDDVAGTSNIVQRVFGFDFGEDAADPNFILDPGFNNAEIPTGIGSPFPNQGLLPAGRTLLFEIVNNLQYWDGTGSAAFGAPPTGVDIGLEKGSFTIHVTGSGTTGAAPSIFDVPTSGRIHQHLGSQLNYFGSFDPDPPNAPAGTYLLGMRLKLTGGGFDDSDPLYIVYNNGLDEDVHAEAIAFVVASLVPEPASWVLMIAGVATLVVVRFRRDSVRRGSNS